MFIEKKDPSETFVSMKEAAKINGVSRQAIFFAIKKGILKAQQKSNRRWKIKLSDLEKYRRQKYSRNKSKYKEELIFDNDKGYYSVKQTANILGVTIFHVYYAVRNKKIKTSRVGGVIVIYKGEIKKYFKNKYLKPTQDLL